MQAMPFSGEMMNLTAARGGAGTYVTGQATVERILDAAQAMVIEGGFARLTMRGLARSLGMSPGNLGYYYRNREALLEGLFTHVLEPYLEEFERLRSLEGGSPEAQLRKVIDFIFEDLGREETTHFFPEVWALALRDEKAAEQMERMYATYRSVLEELIAAMRPDLKPAQVRDLALSISASIEGHTVFVGHGRRHRRRSRQLKLMVVDQSVRLIKEFYDVGDRP